MTTRESAEYLVIRASAPHTAYVAGRARSSQMRAAWFVDAIAERDGCAAAECPHGAVSVPLLGWDRRNHVLAVSAL